MDPHDGSEWLISMVSRLSLSTLRGSAKRRSREWASASAKCYGTLAP
jgi:hypothetical protein